MPALNVLLTDYYSLNSHCTHHYSQPTMHHHLHILFLLTPLINALAPRPPTAFLSSYAFSGTGCPATSSAATLSSSLEKISINLSDSYQVSIGPSIPVVQNRKNCQMNLNISIPTNSRWQLCVGPTTFTGFADLQTNVSATARNSYYFAGSVVSVRPFA